MAWYDPTSWDLSTDADRMNQQRGQYLNNVGSAAANFSQNAGTLFQGADTRNLDAQRKYLQEQAQGAYSVSAEQLRQALQQQFAQQRSAAASANPQNSAMAGLMAARNMNTAGTALAGNQAVAGLQERNQANQALAQLNLGQRGQDLSGFLGGNSNAIGAFGQQAPQGYGTQMLYGALGGLAGVGGQIGAAALSDRRLKTDIKPGDAAAGKAVGSLKAHMFRYKADQAGAPKKLGVMAQDLQKTPGLAHTVVDTPSGKMIHAGHLSTANTAMISHLAKRVGDLEASKHEDKGPLTAAKRKNVPKSEMGLPGNAQKGKGAVSGTYPMPDRRHAALAKSMAAKYASPGQRAKIDAKANRILGER